MEFHQVVMSRRMVRDFDPAPLPAATLERALRHALRAPSAGFTQGWDALLLTEVGDREAFWRAATPDPEAEPDRWLRGVRRAPALVVLCSHPGAYVARYARPDKQRTGLGDGEQAWPVPYWDVDSGMAALLLLLSAVDEGIGGLFFGVPGEGHDAVREAFGVPADRRLVGVVALGRPALPSETSGAAGTAGAAGAAGASAQSEAAEAVEASGASAQSGAAEAVEAVGDSGRARRSHRPRRRSLDEVVHAGRFGTAWRPDSV